MLQPSAKYDFAKTQHSPLMRHLHKHLVTVDILSHNDASWIPSELKKKKKEVER